MQKVDQIEVLGKASVLALALVSIGFFLYVLVKAPALGAVKVTIVLLNALKLTVVGLAAFFWLVLNIKRPTES